MQLAGSDTLYHLCTFQHVIAEHSTDKRDVWCSWDQIHVPLKLLWNLVRSRYIWKPAMQSANVHMYTHAHNNHIYTEG